MHSTKEILMKKEVNGEELEYLLSQRKNHAAEFLLIDVREEYEYNEKRILGVDYLVPLSNFFAKTKEILDFKSKPIIAQCKSGGRSAQAQMQLKLLGFENVINLNGGITKYKGDTV